MTERCCICGKFAKYEDLELYEFTPDSDFTSEDISCAHQVCIDKESKVE